MKRFLVVVDMQNDFVDGALGSKEATAAVENVVKEIERAKAAGATVIATLDTHSPDYLSTREGRCLPVTHCVKGSNGWKINNAVDEALGEA